MKNTEIIQKLLKISQNQQKMIRKLAQAEGMGGSLDITDKVNNILSRVAELPIGTFCVSASLYQTSRSVDVKIQVPGEPGAPTNDALKATLKSVIGSGVGVDAQNVKVTLLFN
jgi:hypothetical protein